MKTEIYLKRQHRIAEYEITFRTNNANVIDTLKEEFTCTIERDIKNPKIKRIQFNLPYTEVYKIFDRLQVALSFAELIILDT